MKLLDIIQEIHFTNQDVLTVVKKRYIGEEYIYHENRDSSICFKIVNIVSGTIYKNKFSSVKIYYTIKGMQYDKLKVFGYSDKQLEVLYKSEYIKFFKTMWSEMNVYGLHMTLHFVNNV